jgi:hypothetical protein
MEEFFMKQSRELLIKNFILGINDNTFKDAISKEFVFNIKEYARIYIWNERCIKWEKRKGITMAVKKSR